MVTQHAVGHYFDQADDTFANFASASLDIDLVSTRDHRGGGGGVRRIVTKERVCIRLWDRIHIWPYPPHPRKTSGTSSQKPNQPAESSSAAEDQWEQTGKTTATAMTGTGGGGENFPPSSLQDNEVKF